MKTNHDGTVTLNAYDTWISCLACGQRVTGDSIHTCSPQLKTLNKDELKIMWQAAMSKADKEEDGEAYEFFANAILKKASEK